VHYRRWYESIYSGTEDYFERKLHTTPRYPRFRVYRSNPEACSEPEETPNLLIKELGDLTTSYNATTIDLIKETLSRGFTVTVSMDSPQEEGEAREYFRAH